MKKFLLLGFSAAGTGWWFYQVYNYQKFSAAWGAFNVLFLGIILALVAGALLLMSSWFTDGESAPGLFIGIAVGTLLIAILGGPFMTEPIERGALVSQAGVQLSPSSPEYQQTAYQRSRAGGWFYYSFYSNHTTVNSSSGSSSSGSFSCGKDCGKGLVAVFLVILAIIVICGSLFVPHFWVAGGLIFLVILWLMTYREWFQVSESSYNYSSYRY
jgi:hypothetical protein